MQLHQHFRRIQTALTLFLRNIFDRNFFLEIISSTGAVDCAWFWVPRGWAGSARIGMIATKGENITENWSISNNTFLSRYHIHAGTSIPLRALKTMRCIKYFRSWTQISQLPYFLASDASRAERAIPRTAKGYAERKGLCGTQRVKVGGGNSTVNIPKWKTPMQLLNHKGVSREFKREFG